MSPYSDMGVRATPPPTNLGGLPLSIVDLNPCPTPCYPTVQNPCTRHVGSGGRKCRKCRSSAERNSAESALTAPKLDRPSLSFGAGADSAESAESAGKSKELFESLRPETNVTPHSDAGLGTIHSGEPDAYQQPLTTNTPYLRDFPTTHETMFLKHNVTDSAISAEASAISRRISAISPRPRQS